MGPQPDDVRLARALRCRRQCVAGRQDVPQGRQALAQALRPMDDRVGHAIGVVRTRPDSVGQVDRALAHLLEQLADNRTRVLGTKRAIPLQGAQQLLPDRVVVRMAPGAQACPVQCLGPPLNFAEQRSPLSRLYRAQTHYIIAPGRCRASRVVNMTSPMNRERAVLVRVSLSRVREAR